MSSFIDHQRVEAISALRGKFVPMPRSQELRSQFIEIVTEHFAHLQLNRPFEARGLLVTGRSRVGKTREIDQLLHGFNNSNSMMPDGRPMRFVQLRLSGRMTFKNLAQGVLGQLNFPDQHKQASERQLWDMVHRQAKRLGVVGIHFDEAQHVFTDSGSAQNRVSLDSFKSMMKDSSWPLMLILSGVPELARHIENDPNSEERIQLRYLLRPIHFEQISISHDMQQLAKVFMAFIKPSGLAFDHLATSSDFYRRAAHASSYRWGLAIEMLLEACTICKLEGCDRLELEHFSKAFGKCYRQTPDYSPFTVPEYLQAFDPDKLMNQIPAER